MNGVKNKFSNENVLDIFKNFDLLCVSETHFGVRSKCPDGFTLIGRSKATASKKLRGGVALFRKNLCSVDIELFYDGFQDSIICRIMNTDVLLVVMYLPPSNSIYFEEKYFDNLDLIYSMFHS